MARNGSKFPWLTVGVALAATALAALALVERNSAGATFASGMTRAPEAVNASVSTAKWATLATFQRPGGNAFEWFTLSAWTTHAVHVSLLHLLGSGTVWLIAAAAVERINRVSLAVMLVVGAPLITWAAMFAEPAMGSYVGLSGLACGCVAWLALERLNEGRIQKSTSLRIMGTVLLLLVTARIGADFSGAGHGWGVALHGSFDASANSATGLRISRYGHFAGAVFGALCWLGYTLRGAFKTKSKSLPAASEKVDGDLRAPSV